MIDSAGKRSMGFVVVVAKDLVERPDGWVFCDDVSWSYHILEPVPL